MLFESSATLARLAQEQKVPELGARRHAFGGFEENADAETPACRPGAGFWRRSGVV
jgi:hypothetical protein